MKLRAVIAGAGLMGYWHAKALERSGDTVVAVVDRDLATARRLAERFRGARAGRSLTEVLGENKVDVLHLCTSLDSHVELATAVLDRGIPVLAEKPLAPTAVETERLYAFAAERKALLCPVHQFPFQRGVQNLMREIGRLGKLRHFEARFCSAGGEGKGNAALDVIVADILPHPLSLLQRFVPGSVQSPEWSISRPAPGEFRATRVEGEIGVSILISMNSRPTCSSLDLLGSDGTAHLDLFHGFNVFEPGGVSRWRKIGHPFALSARTFIAAASNLAGRAGRGESAYPGLRPLIQSFYGAIVRKGESPIPRQEAVAIAAARDALIAGPHSS